jgi:hypothetical protein
VQPGHVYRHDDFYRNDETGKTEPKYLVIFAALPPGDFVARLLTAGRTGAPNPTVLPRTPLLELSLKSCASRMTRTGDVDRPRRWDLHWRTLQMTTGLKDSVTSIRASHTFAPLNDAGAAFFDLVR